MAEPIDLGNESPLSVDGSSGGLVDRRRLSVQWFSGTILTGLCGAALMGGAVFASLDGETNFAAAPERVETALRGALSNLGDRFTGLHKTDRLPALSEPSVARAVLRVPTTTRSRDRETVRVRPYERVFGNLSLTVSEISAKIPAVQSAKNPRRRRRRGRSVGGAATRRRSVVLDLRLRAGAAAGQGHAGGVRDQFAAAATSSLRRFCRSTR